MFELHTGACIDVLKTLPDDSVDSVVTSPPYAMQRASTYGGIPEKDYPEWTVTWMQEVWRVLKDDGSAIINISPHIRGGNLADYVLRTRLALREAGWVEPDELIWYKPNAFPTGRPDRPRRAWEHLLWFGKGKQTYADPLAAGKPYKQDVDESMFRKPDSVAKRNGWGHARGSNGVTPLRDRARVTNIATIAKVSKNKFEHPAPFPVELAEWCGKLVTPPGGTILDPFTGSSSTGVAAIKNGWNFIGIDQSPEYIEMSNRRLSAELAKVTN